MKLSTQLLLTTLSKTSNQVSVFVLSIILARYFTKAEYGTYLHIQLIANIVIWSCLMGIPHSIYYFLNRTYEKKKFIITTLSIILSIAGLTSALVFWGSGLLGQILGNPEVKNLALLLAALILFQIPLTIFEPLMISAKRVQTFVITEFSFNISFFLAVAIPVALDLSMINILQSLILVYAGQSAIVLILSLITAFTLQESKEAENTAYSLKEQVQYSLPIGFSMSAVELSKYADKVIVSNQTSPEDFAVYARGATNIPVISIIANTLDNLIMPKFVQAYKDGNVDELLLVWHSVIRLMAALIYPCCFLLIFTAGWLIPALFSERYADSVPIFQIYTLGLLTRISTYNVIVRAIGKTQAMLWIVIFGMFSNIGLTYGLIQVFGLPGAPMATVITTVVVSYLYLKTITHYLELPLHRIFPWQSLSHSIVASAIALLPLLALQHIDLPVWPLLLLMGSAYGITYLILLKFNRSLIGADKYALRQALPAKLHWII